MIFNPNVPFSGTVAEVLSPKQCKDVIDWALAHGQEQRSHIGGGQNPRIRSGRTVFFINPKIWEIIWPHVEMVNKETGWNLVVEGLETFQMVIYDKTDHYLWHPDSTLVPEHACGKEDRWRKLSFSLLLNDTSEFEGGEFIIEERNVSQQSKNLNDFYSEREVPLKQGEMVVFPSNSLHRVQPVTSGTRYVLVGWIYGPPAV
jgi:PKHD-type hydroxylase